MTNNIIPIPPSYETLPTTDIKLSHYPPGHPTATPIIIVTLNRPEKRNAFTPAMGADLQRVFTMFDVDHRVKAIILTGAGDTFCVGADLEIGRGEKTGKRIRFVSLLSPSFALSLLRVRKERVGIILKQRQ